MMQWLIKSAAGQAMRYDNGAASYQNHHQRAQNRKRFYDLHMPGKTQQSKSIDNDYRMVSLWRVALRDFINFSNRDMKRLGITLLQYQVLLEIQSSPEAENGMTVGLLANCLHMRHNSVVVLINQLARRGHVRRVPSPHDRRSMLLELTAKGKRTLDKLVHGHRLVIDSFLPDLRKALDGAKR